MIVFFFNFKTVHVVIWYKVEKHTLFSPSKHLNYFG